MNELTQFEVARNERGSIDEAIPAKNGGYFQLSHSVFQDPKLRELSGDAFRLFLWLSSQAWRFRDSDGTTRASISFITEATGMSHATVSRSLKVLKEMDLIRLVENDFKRGNRWWISPRAVWSLQGDKLPQNEGAQSEIATTSNRGTGCLKLNRKLPQLEAEIRNTITIKKSKNSLSETLPHSVQEYLEGIQLPLKKARERACFLKLNSAYGANEIAQALLFLRENGIPGSREVCHSPMAFLAQGMNEVLSEIKKLAAIKSKTEEKAQERKTIETQKEEEDLRHQQEWEWKEQAFLAEFPTHKSQEAAVQTWSASLPWKSSNPQAVRSLAICGWWESTQNFRVSGNLGTHTD
mgnify:CR=1 FL=1